MALKSKNAGTFYHKLPSLEELEKLIYQPMIWGASLLGLAVVIGLVWSKAAMASGHVEKEWQAFLHLDRPIFPIIVGDCNLPPLLLPVQRIDFRKEASFYEDVLRLLRAILSNLVATSTRGRVRIDGSKALSSSSMVAMAVSGSLSAPSETSTR